MGSQSGPPYSGPPYSASRPSHRPTPGERSTQGEIDFPPRTRAFDREPPAAGPRGGEAARHFFQRRRPRGLTLGVLGAALALGLAFAALREGPRETPPVEGAELAALAALEAAAPSELLGPTPPTAAAAPDAQVPAVLAPGLTPPPPVAAAPPSSTPPVAPRATPPPDPARAARREAAAGRGKSAPQAAASRPASGGFAVQLLASRSRPDAEREWERLHERHGDLLGPLSHRLEPADLGGERGTVFRLRAGPLASREQARALCEALGARQQDCFVVKN